ncbi:MAG: GyrI-like domain-containing protein [Candidatus Omnitrophota bacterium]
MKKQLFLIFLLMGMGIMMLAQEAPVTIKEGQSYTCAVQEFTGPYTDMEKNIGAFIGEFFRQGLTPAGPMVGIYYNSPMNTKPEDLKWAIGFIVPHDAAVKAPLKKIDWKYPTVVSMMYVGPYEKSSVAYAKMNDYINKNNYKMVGPIQEKYLDNPQQVKPENLRTEISIPVEKIK